MSRYVLYRGLRITIRYDTIYRCTLKECHCMNEDCSNFNHPIISIYNSANSYSDSDDTDSDASDSEEDGDILVV